MAGDGEGDEEEGREQSGGIGKKKRGISYLGTAVDTLALPPWTMTSYHPVVSRALPRNGGATQTLSLIE
jgi:hypothetical protein